MQTDYKSCARNIRMWTDQNEGRMLEDIRRLVQVPSIASSSILDGYLYRGEPAPFGDGPAEALVRMREISLRDEFPVENHNGYYMTEGAGEGSCVIGVWNHLDVVPAGAGWQYPPFDCTRVNGYLIGRGVQDNKGPAVAVHYAMKWCRDHGMLNRFRIRHMLGCDEESGMSDVRRYREHEDLPDWSFVADCRFPVCCGEKGRLGVTLTTECSGSRVMEFCAGQNDNSVPSQARAVIEMEGSITEYAAEGTGGHAAFPEGTVSAVRNLCARIPKASEDRCLAFLMAASENGYGTELGIACEDELSGRLTCNLGTVSTESGNSGFTGKILKLRFDIRYPVTKKAEDILILLRKTAVKFGFFVTNVTDSAPYYMESHNSFIRSLMNAWKTVTDREGAPYVMGGGTYARRLERTVGFGPGQDRDFSVCGLLPGHGSCHCPDEAESVENLKNAAVIYALAFCMMNDHAKELLKDTDSEK